jgi:hypothetical protein
MSSLLVRQADEASAEENQDLLLQEPLAADRPSLIEIIKNSATSCFSLPLLFQLIVLQIHWKIYN